MVSFPFRSLCMHISHVVTPSSENLIVVLYTFYIETLHTTGSEKTEENNHTNQQYVFQSGSRKSELQGS